MSPALDLSRLVLKQSMPQRVVERPSTKDFFFCYFPEACAIGDQESQDIRSAHSWICWNAQHPHFYGRDDHEWIHSCFHLTGSLAYELFRNVPINLVNTVSNPKALDRAFDLLFECLTQQAYNAETMHPVEDKNTATAVSSETNMILQCLRCIVQLCMQSPVRHRDPEMHRVRRYVEAHFQEALCLDAIAEIFHLSVSSLRSRFSAEFGLGIIEQVIRHRMQHAYYLLGERHLSIAEIAQQVGYPDLVYFSHLVKKRFGKSPRALRQAIQQGSS